MKFVGQQLYVVFGPVFDYDADGLADTDFTTARLTALLGCFAHVLHTA